MKSTFENSNKLP